MSNGPFELTVPCIDGNSLSLSVGAGQCLFVLGANGTGKSTLMHRFYVAHQYHARRISAHRQLWFESDAIELSPAARRGLEINIRGIDINPQSRWRDDYAGSRANIAIYDLVDAQNVRARRITSAFEAKELDRAAALAEENAPLKEINTILQLSNMPIAIMIEDNGQVVARRNQGAPYSIAQLSDGERAALLIAANVLTAPADTFLLIDEPERHLHRSIISPLLTNLFAKRPNCAFAISTHDVMLPLDNRRSNTLLLRDFAPDDPRGYVWEANLVPPQTEVDNGLKREILGARRKMLFVEGTAGSLDQSLYNLIFPGVSVVSKSTCRDVERAVFGIREASSLHWLEVWGVIDNDGRSEAEVERLRDRYVHALRLFSVESIYYHPDIIKRVAERRASVSGADPEERLERAKERALASLSDADQQRLSARAVEKRIRERIFQSLPTVDNISTGEPVDIRIDVAGEVAEERAKLKEAIASRDLLTIVARYPIRESPLLDQLARNLRLEGRTEYEEAVRKLLTDDKEAVQLVRSFFGSLVEEMGVC